MGSAQLIDFDITFLMLCNDWPSTLSNIGSIQILAGKEVRTHPCQTFGNQTLYSTRNNAEFQQIWYGSGKTMSQASWNSRRYHDLHVLECTALNGCLTSILTDFISGMKLIVRTPFMHCAAWKPHTLPSRLNVLIQNYFLMKNVLASRLSYLPPIPYQRHKKHWIILSGSSADSPRPSAGGNLFNEG